MKKLKLICLIAILFVSQTMLANNDKDKNKKKENKKTTVAKPTVNNKKTNKCECCFEYTTVSGGVNCVDTFGHLVAQVGATTTDHTQCFDDTPETVVDRPKTIEFCP